MNIFEINQALLDCVDSETGEVIDIEQLLALNMERSEKLENIACWIVDLNAEAKAIKEQEQILKERREKAEAKAESLKHLLGDIMPGEKMKTGRVSISWRTSKALEIDDNAVIDDGFMITKTTVTPDKKAIKQAIEEGHVFPGCRIVEHLNCQIK